MEKRGRESARGEEKIQRCRPWKIERKKTEEREKGRPNGKNGGRRGRGQKYKREVGGGWGRARLEKKGGEEEGRGLRERYFRRS